MGKYPTGHKTQTLRFHQRDSPDFESLLGAIDGLITGPLPLNRADTGRYRLRPYSTFLARDERSVELYKHACRSFTLDVSTLEQTHNI